MTDVQVLLAELGYRQTYAVTGLKSIARLYGKRKRRCGIYVLHFANGEYYVGKSIDVVKRFSQHCKTHADIDYISFKPVAEDKLDQVESAIVRSFERANQRLRNINIVEFSHRATPFDELMPKDAQFHWLEDIRQIDLQGERISDTDLKSKYSAKFQKFLQLPGAEQVIALTAEYVRLCVPCPKRSELLYWNVSCLPQPDLFLRLNVGWQETFVVQRDSAGNLVAIHWYFGTDGVEKFATHPQARRWERFWNSVFRYYDIVETSHKAAGPPQSRVSVYSLDDARKVLSDVNAVLTMRQTNLGLAQKRASGYQRNHCLDLADAIFARMDG